MSEKWRMHIIGPDDLIPQPDELTALREANRLNIELAKDRAKHANDPNYPFAMAIVEPTPQEAASESHP